MAVLGLGKSDHLVGEVTLKPNDLGRTRPMSSTVLAIQKQASEGVDRRLWDSPLSPRIIS